MRAGGASPKRMTRLLATGVLIAFYCFGLAMAATFSPAQARGRGGGHGFARGFRGGGRGFARSGISLVVDLLAVSAGEGLLEVVDFVGVGVGAGVGAGGGPASMAPIAGGVRVAAVGSAHTIDRRALRSGKWEQRLAYQGNVAIKALEMLGRDLGMFAQRQPRDEDNPQMLRVLIDKPPDEKSNGLPRTERTRGLPPAQFGAAVGSAETDAIAKSVVQAFAAGGGRTRAKADHQDARRAKQVHPSLAKRIASSSHLGGSQDPHEARARPQGSARAWAGPKTAPQPSFFSVPMRLMISVA